MIPRLRQFQLYYIKYDMISIKFIYKNNFHWLCLAEIYWSKCKVLIKFGTCMTLISEYMYKVFVHYPRVFLYSFNFFKILSFFTCFLDIF